MPRSRASPPEISRPDLRRLAKGILGGYDARALRPRFAFGAAARAARMRASSASAGSSAGSWGTSSPRKALANRVSSSRSSRWAARAASAVSRSMLAKAPSMRRTTASVAVLSASGSRALSGRRSSGAVAPDHILLPEPVHRQSFRSSRTAPRTLTAKSRNIERARHFGRQSNPLHLSIRGKHPRRLPRRS